ncbi:MAG: hydrolase [Clostridia bacterium]|nr:hydrolase [Clostridia bacterium]
MEETVINQNKEEFIKIFNENIKREGAQELLEWLKKTDFFIAPASTKFHSAVAGGLCFHSLQTYKRFKQNLENEYGDELNNKVSNETIAIIALLHDVCKTDCYKIDYRNVKVNNEWTKQPYYSFNDSLPYGHGEKSVYMISGFMKLTREEALAINWHMGGFDSRVLGGSSYSLSAAFSQHPLCVLFHIADIQASYLDEEINNK